MYSNIIDIWQVSQTPSVRNGIRMAARIMTNRRETSGGSPWMSYTHWEHSSFRPADVLVWVQVDISLLAPQLSKWLVRSPEEN
jgi:hypothetical protein